MSDKRCNFVRYFFTMKKLLTTLFSILPFMVWPQSGSMKMVRQRFHHDMPAGNYSGICALGDGRYAVVDDKAPEDGFYVFRIDIDREKGRISAIGNEGYRSCGLPNRDMEGICYCPGTQTLFVSGEADNEVFEYRLDGQRTGRRLAMPAMFRNAKTNGGLEALAYDRQRHLFITTTEQPLKGDTLLRIQTFGDDLLPREQYLYLPDSNIIGGKKGSIRKGDTHGVSAMCVLDNGRLLVMERQIRVPRLKIGARAVTRIYEVRLPDAARHEERSSPLLLEKRLVREIKTRLTLIGRRFANCEGMCEPFPGMLLVVADSQDRYKGVLRDWFLTLKDIGGSDTE